MSEDRPTRDVLAEMMRRERLGLMRPFWADWCRFDDSGPEQWRLRADHLIRLLAREGYTIAKTGDAAEPTPAHASPVFWRYWMHGSQSERLLRMAENDQIEVVRLTDGIEMVQIAFSLGEIHATASALLLGDREMAKRQGILTMLSAALEAYRLDVAVMEPAT